jgi:serine/threonine-protein kinase
MTAAVDTAVSRIFYPGMRLDRYELLCALAQGGMGAVWLARYAGKFGFTRLVVVKVMLPHYASDEKMRAMFIDEARIAASIDHPNVVATLDVGEQDGLLFLVMNWVDGDSLSHLVKQVAQNNDRLPSGVALKIAADVCAGLHAAHELRDENGELRGLVHRDVSPQNILLSLTGRAMLIDFGIAKANKRVSEETSIGRIKGKLGYMSPEQARTGHVDRRADVFSVGAVLYEVFAGFPPFEKENDIQTLTRLTRGGPAAPLPRGTPPAVQSVVMRSLALDPLQRYQTAREMGHELVVAMREIGEPMTEQEVAHYAEEYLSGRRKQRQRAVNNALFAADDTMMAARIESDGPPLVPDGRDGMKVTLEFDASPFASALGPYGQANQTGGYPTVPPPMSGAELLHSQSSSYPIRSLVGPPFQTDAQPPAAQNDPLRALWDSIQRSKPGQAALAQLTRWKVTPAQAGIMLLAFLSVLVALLVLITATRNPDRRVADPLPTMTIPTQSPQGVVAPIPGPRRDVPPGPQPLVQQGTPTTTPTWSPTPSPPAPGTATATSTSFTIPAPTSVRKHPKGKGAAYDPEVGF